MNPNLDGLFGPSPEMIGRQQYEMMRARAAQEAQMSDIERANYGMRTAGATLGHVGAGMLGSGNPAIEEAKMREQAMGGLDTSSSKSILMTAERIQDPRIKFQLVQLARQRQAEEQKAEMDAVEMKRKEAQTERELALAERALRDPVVKNEAGKTRTYQKGTKSITEELQADGTWKVLGSGPKFSKQVINVGTGVDQGKEEFTPEVVDFYATQALLTGDQSWRTGLGRSKDGVKLIIAVDKRIPAMAKEVGMTAEEASNNKQMFAARLKAIKDFSTGTQGQMVTSFNTAIDHLDTLKELGNALKNGNLQLANRIKNTAAEWTGDADITNLDTAKQIVGAEIIKAIVARGGGVQEREEAAQRISRISSPEQMAGYIETAQKLMAGQLKSLERQYEVNTNRKDFKDKLLPRAKSVLSSLGGAEKVEGSVSQIPTAAPAQKRIRFDAQGNMVQ